MKKVLISLIMTAFSMGLMANSSPELVDVNCAKTDNEASVVQNMQTDEADDQDEQSADYKKSKVFLFPIREDIMPSTVRLTAKCLEAASQMNANYIVINMNTYGGIVDAADSIRTMLLNCKIPVITFINNQAASAGALIAIATDSIYMRPGASIGAATVVDQKGTPMPDKYQSFMRSMMRSTAESHGKVTVVENGKEASRWRRDPLIAEAMVDETIAVPGVVEEGKILTFTADEAIRWGYCEGKASTVQEVLESAEIIDYEITEYKTTWLDKLLGFLTNPALQGIFIMLIIGGIYFELQSPGVGFPLFVAIVGALLYFSPLYVEGLVSHWDLVIFISGLILIALEIFVTPGFGVLGILGIIAVITGLAFALIDAELLKYIPTGEISLGIIVKPFATVVISTVVAFVAILFFGDKFLKGNSAIRNKIALDFDMTPEEGFTSFENNRQLVGREGVTSTNLRPTGKVIIDGRYYEASGENAMYIERGVGIVVVRDEGGVLYCKSK